MQSATHIIVNAVLKPLMVVSVLLLAMPAQAQWRRPYMKVNAALGNNHREADSLHHANWNIGLLSTTDRLSGMQLGVLSAVALDQTRGANMGGLFALTVDSLSGFQLSLLSNAVGGKAQGLQLAGVINNAQTFSGLQLALGVNISQQPFRGWQIAGVTNIALGVSRGVQTAALANVSSGAMRGAQIGGYNIADTLTGSQVGLINVATFHPRGWQIGLVNYSRSTTAHKVGLVNIGPETTVDMMFFGGSSNKLNAAVAFRNRSTYSIVGVGSHFMGFDEDFSGSIYYRWGKWLSLSRRWSLSSDVGYYHVETFKKNSTDGPERLYSLQWHLNAAYKINPTLGAFVSTGFGTTRYYGTHHNYRTRPLIEAGITVSYPRNVADRNRRRALRMASDSSLVAQARLRPIGSYVWDNPEQPKRSFWRPAVGVVGINAFVHCFDRFIMNQDYAQVHFKDIAHNWRNGFVWDNDQFSTNLFAHPYHGNLYFNMARSYGLNFWQSAPYALAGSFMWEMCGEIEPPAINDLMATTFGGIGIGEVLHRVSNLMLNDRTRGTNRFLRELGACVTNPMGFLRRLMTGDAWRHREQYYLYHDYNALPIDFSISTGVRYLADDGRLFQGEWNPYVNLYLEYGDPFNSEMRRPYDFFDFEATFGFSSNQPIINRLHILGRLWTAPIYIGRNVEAEMGLFQHFNYLDSKPVKDGTNLTPYRISEAASVGPGAIVRFPASGVLRKLEQRIFLSGILLGGTKSDYYNVIDRDYNMGSGFSLKTKTHMEFRNVGRLILRTDYYRIFTWKGYEGKDLEHTDPLYLNAQGDKSNAELVVINPIWELDFRGRLSATVMSSYYLRHTRYKYHDNVRAHTFEVRVGLTYHF